MRLALKSKQSVLSVEGWVSREISPNYKGRSNSFYDQHSRVSKLLNLEQGRRYLVESQ